MYILFFLMWVIFNGSITPEITLFGLVIAGAMYAFACAFLGYSLKQDIRICKKSPRILGYILVLVWEIVKANFTLIHMILVPGFKNRPVIVRFRTHLKSKAARVALANSITLTPGTITVSLEGDEYTVHCLDKSLAEGIDSSVFVRLLEKLEA